MSEWVYSEGIEEIKPLTLNMSLHPHGEKEIEIELRKKTIIKLDNPSFWIDLFSKSLEGKPMRASVIIVFRDPFGTACKLKELGLLKQKTKLLE